MPGWKAWSLTSSSDKSGLFPIPLQTREWDQITSGTVHQFTTTGAGSWAPHLLNPARSLGSFDLTMRASTLRAIAVKCLRYILIHFFTHFSHLIPPESWELVKLGKDFSFKRQPLPLGKACSPRNINLSFFAKIGSLSAFYLCILVSTLF